MSFTGIVFQQPWRLLGLCAVPFFILLFFAMLHWTKIKLERFGQMSLIRRITPENSVRKQYVKFIFMNLAFILIVVSLAKPSLSYRTRVNQAADIYIVLDVSRSMLATDAYPNRLQAVLSLVKEVINKTTNVKMGLIPFAGQAIVQVPLSGDKKTILAFLSQMQPETIPVQGTLIGPALNLAAASFGNEPSRARMILLFTDGENYDQEALNAAAALKDKHQSLIIYGVGSAQGSRIPVQVNGRFKEFKKDRQGKIVISKFNRPFLDSLAGAAAGKVFTLSGMNTQKLQGLIQKEIAMKRFIYREEVRNIEYPIGLALALLLLLIEFMLSERKKGFITYLQNKLKGWKLLFFPGLLFMVPLGSSAQVSYYSARKGNEAYRQGKFSLAEKLYRTNSTQIPQPALVFNTASALYQQGRYAQAATLFSTLLADKDASSLYQQAWYDLGNCRLQQGLYAQSITAYIQSLELRSNDADAFYNLAYARLMLKKQIPPPPSFSQSRPPPPMGMKKPPALKTDLKKSNANAAASAGDLPQDW